MLLEDQPDVGVGQRQLWDSSGRLRECCPRLFEPIECPEDVAQVVVQLGRVGSRRTASWQYARASSAWPRFKSIWPRFVRGAAKVGSSSAARRKWASGLVRLREVAENQAQVVMRDREIRPKLDRPAERLDGLVRSFQVSQRRPQVAERLGIIRPQSERAARQLSAARSNSLRHDAPRPDWNGKDKRSDAVPRLGRSTARPRRDRRPGGAAILASGGPRRCFRHATRRFRTASPPLRAARTGAAPSRPSATLRICRFVAFMTSPVARA